MPGKAAERIDTTTKITRASVGSSDQYSASPPTTPAIIRFERERRSGFRISTIACLRKSLHQLRGTLHGCPETRLPVPGDGIANADQSAPQHLRKRAATP